MNPTSIITAQERSEATIVTASATHWASRASLLWKHRRLMAKVTAISLILSLAMAFTIPKRYKASTRIMPPDQQSSGGAMMLAALAGRAGGLSGLSGLAGDLLGMRSSTALFMDLLKSGTVKGHLIDRFNLQHVYRKRYRVDTAKRLAKFTTITDDKKSGVITLEVEDTSPVRARDLAQAYLDELNKLVLQTNTSSAHQERVFIEQRLRKVQADLEQAQIELSDFSSKNSTIDIKEQTRAMVDAGARIQAQLMVEQAGLQSLRQIYGDGNVRVRESEARIGALQADLTKMTGSSSVPSSDTETGTSSDSDKLYPPLRQLPRLAVPLADLYRRVKVQETVFELLTQQYELARINEAKDVPVVSIIDPPGIPEKKSYPHRLILSLALTLISFGVTSAFLLMRDGWSKLHPADPRKVLASEIVPVVSRHLHRIGRRGKDQQ